MGEMGFPTRVLSAVWGGLYTYAAPNAAEGTASGQVSARQMRHLYRVERFTKNAKIFGVIADPVRHSISPAVHNRAVQQTVRDLQSAIRRGERFSRELERHGDMFPPIVSQLVIIGEQTGKLTGATTHICGHLKREIQRKTNIFVGALEPILTICLASAVAVILLAIYLPMFDMVNTVGK